MLGSKGSFPASHGLRGEETAERPPLPCDREERQPQVQARTEEARLEDGRELDQGPGQPRAGPGGAACVIE